VNGSAGCGFIISGESATREDGETQGRGDNGTRGLQRTTAAGRHRCRRPATAVAAPELRQEGGGG
jgi:hypothetical protein